MNNDKLITCGIFIHDKNKNFFSVFPYGGKDRSWSIPKGISEKGEMFIQTACREFKEECGLYVQNIVKDIKYIGIFNYLKNKNLCLFSACVSEFFDLKKCKCTSYFEDEYGNRYPEISDYRILNLEKDSELISYKMYNVLNLNYNYILNVESRQK